MFDALRELMVPPDPPKRPIGFVTPEDKASKKPSARARSKSCAGGKRQDLTPAPHIAPDPDDDVVIGTALAAKADLIVTGDKSLLTVSEHQGVKIVSVGLAINDIKPTGKD